MNLPNDFRDILVCLADAHAEFVVVGGYAVAHHGYVRATKDLDILVRAGTTNADRVLRALVAFGAPLRSLNISEEDFAVEGKVIQIGVPPLRIDLLTSVSGIGFDRAIENASLLDVDGRRVPIIGKEPLLENKQASGRPQDLADIAALRRGAKRP